MKNIRTYNESLSMNMDIDDNGGMDRKDILRCMDTVRVISVDYYPGLEILGDTFFQLRTNQEWGKEKLEKGLGRIYPNLYRHSISFGAEFPLGDVTVDVTPFREAREELVPVVWVHGTQLNTPESSVIRGGLHVFLDNPQIRSVRSRQDEIIERGVVEAKSILDDYLRQEISADPSGEDLVIFETIHELMDYFKGDIDRDDIDWMPAGIKSAIRRMQRSQDLFGED